MMDGSQFKASLRMLDTDAGGREQPVALVIGYAATHWYRPQFARIVDGAPHYDCFIEHPAPETVSWFELYPGEEADVIVQLFTTLPLEVGEAFFVYEVQRLVGKGVITEIY